MQFWVSHVGPSPTTSATVREITSTIAILRQLILPFLKMGTWGEIAILLVLAMLAIVGMVQSAGVLFRAFKKFGAVTGKIYMVLTLLVSFSFFQSQANGYLEARIAILNKHLENVNAANAAAYVEAEQAALDVIADELPAERVFREAYRAVVRLLEFRDAWSNEEQKYQKLIRNWTIKGKAGSVENLVERGFRGWAEAAKLIDDQYEDVRSRPGNRVRPLEVESSIAKFEKLRETIREFRSALVQPKLSVADNELRGMVRKVLELGYKGTVGESLQAVFVGRPDGIPQEMITMILDPVFLEPVRTLVIETAEKFVEAALAQATPLEISHRVRAFVNEGLRTLDLLPIRDRIQSLDRRITSFLAAEETARAKGREHAARTAQSEIPGFVLEIEQAYNARFSFKEGFEIALTAKTTRQRIIGTALGLGNRNGSVAVIEALHAIADKVSGTPVSGSTRDRFGALIKLEKDLLHTSQITNAINTDVKRILQNDHSTRWGKVRALLAPAIERKELFGGKLSPEQNAAWAEIWGRWQKVEREKATEIVLTEPDRSRTRQEIFDQVFTEHLMADKELAAIWGYTAKGFIDPGAKEAYYNEQFKELDTVMKVRSSENFTVQEAVIRPALQSRLGHPVTDKELAKHISAAYDRLRRGELDSFINFDRIKAVISERGMIPHYGLEHYLKSSGTYRAELFESVVKSKQWDDTINNYCKPGR